MGNATPIKERARRMQPKWEAEVERQLDEMVTNGVCRPSHSPWAINVVFVKKKDGSLRFAIDYRQLNNATKKDAYSLPNIQTILDKLEGNQYFSLLDIASASWSVPVKKTDIEKTAFHTPRGQYEMVIMPFGLCNSQATFQRLMDNILEEVPRAEAYVDDCCVFSRTFESILGICGTRLQEFEG
ncbi:Retroviral-like aspartic protease 1 [Oopsacas minuta]|uniref:Retroviral-like aspartic protease 1 n=1 Tax=Oopsacas minuta TaxID=111878 RepID=A0AAV7KDI6_9METZ|nr:Retroviral-like aspartic protease 1 [Oopsacas minuta]